MLERDTDQPTTVDQSQSFTQAPSIVSTAHNGDVVLLNAARGQYHALNDVSARVWELLASSMTPEGIIAVLLHEYRFPVDMPADQLRRDVANLMDEFQRLGLIVHA